jgi:hypothetical protein
MPTTKPNYKTESHPFLGEDERDCCKEEEPPQDGEPHDCRDTWEENYKKAVNALKIASAKAGEATLAFGNASTWESKLKKWIEDAETAHVGALKVFSDLNHFLTVVGRMEENAARTTRAIQAILCLVKEIFDAMQKLLRISTSSDDPKGALQALKLFIECNKDLDEKQKQGALGCLKSYEGLMRDIHALQASILNKLLEILKSADVLAAMMGTPDAEAKMNVGLKWQLEDLRKRIIGETTAKAKVHTCGCHGTPQNQTEAGPPCGKEIAEPAERLLPIRAMTVDNQELPDSAYYSGLKELYDAAGTTSKSYETRMNEAKTESDKAMARKESLGLAIKAAEAAETAK